MKPKRIIFFGNFGTKNLGNECTLDAIIHVALNRVPGVRLTCLCPAPEDTAARHNISAVGSVAAFSWARSPKWVRRIFRVPVEMLHWAIGIGLMMGTEMFIVPGTGLISDHLTGPYWLAL